MNLKAILEGILFVVGDEGISIDKLSKVLDISLADLNKILDEYMADLESSDRGLQLEKYNDNYKLVTKKEHAEYYKKLVDNEVSDVLSPAALETLAIIAYNGPITRNMIDEVRGVNSIYVIRKLVLKNLVKEVTATQLRDDVPVFSSGDTIKVSVRITENGKTRIQIFEGVVMARRGGGVNETFTVRKISSGIGVERIFPLHSPNVTKIEVVKRGKVRRNKINYLRQRSGKSARIKQILK